MRCEGEPPPPQPQPSPIIVTYFRDSVYARTHTSWTRGGHEDAWATGRELSRARLFKATAISPPTVPHRLHPRHYINYYVHMYIHTHTRSRVYGDGFVIVLSLFWILFDARGCLIIIKFVSAYMLYVRDTPSVQQTPKMHHVTELYE